MDSAEPSFGSAREGRWLARAERLLREAQSLVGLVYHCRPLNYETELQRLLRSWSQALPDAPRYIYRAAPQINETRRALQRLISELDGVGPIAALYAARAEELELEGQMAQAVSSGQLAPLARWRFQSSQRVDPALSSLVQHWLSLTPEPAASLSLSDAASDPASLLRQMLRVSAEAGLSFRCEINPDLIAAAATGQGVFFVAPGRKLRPEAAHRIAVHEVYGHGLPGYRAKQQALGLFHLGSARGLDEQEGYAIWCEQRAGLLDAERRCELAARHHAADLCLTGASYIEACTALIAKGVSVESAVTITARVYRGGGLAREISYLPAFVRVSAAIAHDPEIETWLSAGRLALPAIAVLRAAGIAVK